MNEGDGDGDTSRFVAFLGAVYVLCIDLNVIDLVRLPITPHALARFACTDYDSV